MRRGTAQDRLAARGHVVSGFERSTVADGLETLQVGRLHARAALFHFRVGVKGVLIEVAETSSAPIRSRLTPAPGAKITRR